VTLEESAYKYRGTERSGPHNASQTETFIFTFGKCFYLKQLSLHSSCNNKKKKI